MDTLHKVRSVTRHGENLSRTTFETACRSMDNDVRARRRSYSSVTRATSSSSHSVGLGENVCGLTGDVGNVSRERGETTPVSVTGRGSARIFENPNTPPRRRDSR